MRGYFSSSHHKVNLREQVDSPNRGFRPGQWGALHAVLAHTSVHDEPSVICLPTGYGKTAVMMALPFLLRADRVLIVEPSDALRRQVSSHFQVLSTLRRIGVIPEEMASPAVKRHEERPATEADWRELEDYDVVVSTPNSSSPSLTKGCPSSLFDLIIFDEAHHVPAQTWAAYLKHFAGQATFVFLTATPFRRDRKMIPGKLVYRYPISRAVQEGAFEPVDFHAAHVERPLDDAHVDQAIATAAVAQLKADRAAGLDHRLMARASSITSARGLALLYQAEGINVEAVTSNISRRKQDEIEARLKTGELDGIVCVDMFGEGYDFPKLKIAALHAPHASLVPTIQFIGRFARVDPSTGRGTLIAPLSRMREATAELLAEGIDLVRMLDVAALAEIEGHSRAQELLEQLPVHIQRESDYEAVSPLTLELYAHAVVFECTQAPDFSLIGDSLGRGLRVAKQWLSGDKAVTLALTVDENPPNWATAEVLVNIRHDAFLLTYRPDSRLCFIGSTRRQKKLYLNIMDTICKDGYRYLSYEETSRARTGLENVRFYAVGLRNTTLNSRAESYRVMTGPQAERQLGVGDSRGYVQGHFYGSGDDGDGERETIGASGSSRIWSNRTLPVSDYLEWVNRINSRLSGNLPFAVSHLDLVRSTKTLSRLPETIIAAMWPKSAFRSNPRVRYRDAQHSLHHLLLTDLELCDFVCHPQDGALDFNVRSDGFVASMRFTIGAGRMVSAAGAVTGAEIEDGFDQWTALDEWMAESPPVFFAADKSSFEGVNLVAPPTRRAERLADGDADAIVWENCAIRVEFLPRDDSAGTRQRRAALSGQLTVQEYLERHLLADAHLATLFYDHRSGEAADYIAIRQSPDGQVEVTLYHCKGAGGEPSGGRVEDIYELSGQLVKSVAYCDVHVMADHMSSRMDSRYASPSRFCKGTFEEAEGILLGTIATSLSFNIVAVQPGVSKRAIDAHLADLMAHSIGYARQGGVARAQWLVSP